MKLAGALLLLLSFTARAAEVTETFSTRDKMISGGTAIWNHALGVVHSTLVVNGYTGAATPDTAVDVGDGSDGAFIPARYAEFDEGDPTDNIILLNTNRFPVLQVTTFLLEENWILEPTGDNPLRIRSLSDVIIRGEIWCHGHDGEPPSGATGGGGGEGRCGGADGGDGGDTGQPGQDGDDSAAPVTGGAGGSANGGGAGMGGGGGGSWNTANAPGDGPTFVNLTGGQDPGERGTSNNDPEFDIITLGGLWAAGAGGGGGGAGSTGPGGGGGGGGGMVIIHTVRDFEIGSATDNTIGFIYAHGGDGADSTGNGGGGAGGGGGSVQVFAGGFLRMYSNSGLAAGQAVGGRNPAPNAAAAGGSGRNWWTSRFYSGLGFIDPAENLPVIPGDFAKFSTASESVESGIYDLANTLADVTAVAPSPASGDFTILFRGSNDGFASDDTGWTSSLAALSSKRYVRFHFTVRNSVATSPVLLDSLTFVYTPGTRGEFEFKSAAGCFRVDDSRGGGSNGSWLLLFPVILLLRIRWQAYRCGTW